MTFIDELTNTWGYQRIPIFTIGGLNGHRELPSVFQRGGIGSEGVIS
jgi:hypothetical protein